MKKILSLLFLIVLIVSIALPRTSASTKQLEHFIYEGQGDATLNKAPRGKTMLVEGGPSSAGKLDYGVVATLPDADHIGSLIKVLKSIPVKNFINSGKAHTTDTYYEILTLVDKKNISGLYTVYPDEMGIGHAYQSGMDRDKDGWALNDI